MNYTRLQRVVSMSTILGNPTKGERGGVNKVLMNQLSFWLSNPTLPHCKGQSPTLTHAPNYYDVLGLSRDASEQEIVKAWRKAVLLHHPDKHVLNSTSNTLTNVDIRLINEAKWILSDEKRRSEWEDIYFASGMMQHVTSMRQD